MRNPLTRIHTAWLNVQKRRSAPLRIEFNLSDHCNLNCRGCTHYSPLAPAEYEPLDRVKRNLEHLADVCGDAIEVLYIIGGEPLIAPHELLTGTMRHMRECFPKARLHLFTNGLALHRMTDDFWDIARRCGIVISMTRYPVNFDYDAAERLVRSRGVELQIFDDRGNAATWFRYPLSPSKSHNRFVSHFRCYNWGCLTVVGDKLYPCSISACSGHLNRAFGTHFEHCEGDYLVVERITSVKQIRRLRNRPVPFCGYCAHHEIVDYAPSRRERSEWL